MSWAHPEFGNLIASCSDDKNIKIWEEKESVTTAPSKWENRAKLTESKKSVHDVKFAPRHLGLQLASASADGYIRIYEATDVFSLNYWQVQESFQINSKSNDSVDHELTCISWNECPVEPAKLAIGTSKYATIWGVGSNGKWREEDILHEGPDKAVCDIAWAPVMGRSFHQIALAYRDKYVKIYKLKRLEDGSIKSEEPASVMDCGTNVWRIAWNATGTVLATCGDDGKLKLWRKNFAGTFECIQEMEFGDESLRTHYAM